MILGYVMCVIALICLQVEAATKEEIDDFINKIDPPKSLFTLPEADIAMLDELNTMRSLIAQGYLNDPLKAIKKLIFKAVGGLVVGLAKGVEKTLKEMEQFGEQLGVKLYDLSKQTLDWGGKLVNTENVVNDIISFGESGIQAAKKTVEGGLRRLGLPIKKRRKKRFLESLAATVVNFVDDVVETLKKPENVFGPATDMNLLVWNRRLSQLAMANKAEIEAKGLREITYDGKKYRVNKYGTIATYVISKTMGKFITGLFTYVRIGYLACKLWFGKVDIPRQTVDQTIDKTHEMLFADRTEVGCFYTWPDTICIIGPLLTETGYLYKGGTTCSDCKYGCSNSTCNPSPEYFSKMRERYKKHLRPKIEKFEVVEGFDGSAPFLGKNFMIDSSDHSNVLIVSIVSVSLIFLIRNLF